MSYKELTVPQMKSIATSYAQRILDESNQTNSAIELKDEFLMLKLDKSIIEDMLSASKADGLLAILAIDSIIPEKQSVILVPCDNNGKAIKYNSNTVLKGAEMWLTVGRTMKKVIYPNNSSTPNISQGIDDVFNDVNM